MKFIYRYHTCKILCRILWNEFLSYLNQYRLMHAVQELSTTDKNIDEIAIDSGFSSSHAFVSLFKKQYDMLPKEYRKEQKSNKENSHQQIEQHNYIAGLKNT